jgi:DeoR/GlpR family transcriptional regulator of sugar metabolism
LQYINANKLKYRNMSKKKRQQYILNKLQAYGRIHLLDISQELAVSDDTIRRDLQELDANGLLVKVHGGAIPKSGTPLEYAQRAKTDIDKKQIIAQKAVSLVVNHQVIYLDGGTTGVEVAKLLPKDLKATIITNSIPVAAVLCDHPTIELILLGGKVFKASQVSVGLTTLQAVAQVHADIFLLGVCSIHYERGVTVPDYEEAQLKKQMVDNSDKVIALASHSKLNTAEPYVICPYNRLDVMLLDQKTPDDLLQPYFQAGIEIF